jgi:hypothetical protein
MPNKSMNKQFSSLEFVFWLLIIPCILYLELKITSQTPLPSRQL